MARRLMKKKKEKIPLSPGQKAAKVLFIILAVVAALVLAFIVTFKLLAQPPKIQEETPPPAEGGAVSLQSPGQEESAQPARQRKEYTYTFLLCASDQASGNVDTMIVATYDTVNQTIAMVFSAPRRGFPRSMDRPLTAPSGGTPQ